MGFRFGVWGFEGFVWEEFYLYIDFCGLFFWCWSGFFVDNSCFVKFGYVGEYWEEED